MFIPWMFEQNCSQTCIVFSVRFIYHTYEDYVFYTTQSKPIEQLWTQWICTAYTNTYIGIVFPSILFVHFVIIYFSFIRFILSFVLFVSFVRSLKFVFSFGIVSVRFIALHSYTLKHIQFSILTAIACVAHGISFRCCSSCILW